MPVPCHRWRATRRRRSSRRFHTNIAEAAWRRAVADVHRLRRLALAAVDDAVHLPLGWARNRVAGSPELGCLSAVDRVADQTDALAVDDLPPVLGAELEVEAAVVDAPGAVSLEVDAVLGGGDHLLEAGGARLEIDVGHADDRQPRPAVGPHRAVAQLADGGRRLTRGQVSGEDALVDEH